MLAAMRAGYAELLASDNPLDAVEAAVRILEDSEAFNAGKHVQKHNNIQDIYSAPFEESIN